MNILEMRSCSNPAIHYLIESEAAPVKLHKHARNILVMELGGPLLHQMNAHEVKRVLSDCDHQPVREAYERSYEEFESFLKENGIGTEAYRLHVARLES